MQPKDIANQDYSEGGDDEEYYEDDYYPTNAELLRQQLAEANRAKEELARQLAKSQMNHTGRPKKKIHKKNPDCCD